jgi:hypothetical protein
MIAGLDPVRDHEEIYRISAGLEFPWDYQRALELALFRTYCVPSISALLDRTGEFARRPQKRYDDTALLMAELAAHGYDSERGKAALRVVNRLHGTYSISNDDMRYVLATFVYDPIDWLDRYGWRPLHEHEKLAAFHFYRAVGHRMGIRDIPADFAEFAALKQDYERRMFTYSPSNARIGQYTVDLFCTWYPLVPRRATAAAIRGFLDDRILASFGFPHPPAWLPALATTGLRFRAAIIRQLPPRRTSRLANDPTNRTYPGYPTGYHPSNLGP